MRLGIQRKKWTVLSLIRSDRGGIGTRQPADQPLLR
jgi:hypothetical protein